MDITKIEITSEKDRWEKCQTCGDYEYCAGNYGTEKCTGYIPGTTEIV